MPRRPPPVDWPRAHLIVTGGSSGIGLAVAREAAGRGSRVSLIARGEERLAAAARTLRDGGAAVATAAADVSDREAVRSALERLVDAQGPCDALVTSAGISHPGYFEQLDVDVFREMMEVNYFGTLHPIRAVLPGMVERGRGSIVGISSAAGLLGVFGYSAYGASKFAVRGLLESLRAEVVHHGVHVGCCFPPDVDTPMLAAEAALKPPETDAIAGTIRPLAPEVVARGVLAGIDRRRFWIIPDLATRALSRFAGPGREVVERIVDRKAARARNG